MEKSNDRKRVDSSDNFFNTELPLFKSSEVRCGFTIITVEFRWPRELRKRGKQKLHEGRTIAAHLQRFGRRLGIPLPIIAEAQFRTKGLVNITVLNLCLTNLSKVEVQVGASHQLRQVSFKLKVAKGNRILLKKTVRHLSIRHNKQTLFATFRSKQPEVMKPAIRTACRGKRHGFLVLVEHWDDRQMAMFLSWLVGVKTDHIIVVSIEVFAMSYDYQIRNAVIVEIYSVLAILELHHGVVIQKRGRVRAGYGDLLGRD